MALKSTSYTKIRLVSILVLVFYAVAALHCAFPNVSHDAEEHQEFCAFCSLLFTSIIVAIVIGVPFFLNREISRLSISDALYHATCLDAPASPRAPPRTY